MASSSNSSLASDLSRIVILGIAFDLSRCAAREILGALLTATFHNNGSADEKCQDQGTKSSGEKQHLPGNGESDPVESRVEKEEQFNSAVIGLREGISTLNSSLTDIFERWKIYLKRLQTNFPDGMHGIGHAGLCCNLLLSPPLLMCSAWDFLCRNNKVQRPLRDGIYFSSVALSFGLVLWITPEIISWGNDEKNDHNDKGDKVVGVYPDNQEERPEKLGEPSEKAVEDPPKSSPIPTSVVRPPLAPSSSELEQRPRSDSLRSLMSEVSVSTQTMNAPTVQTNEKKYLEMLVHNVSHTDLILGLSGLASKARRAASVPFPAEFEATPRKKNVSPHNNATDSEEYIMCRPRFSAFDLFSRRVLCELQGQIESASPEELNSNNSASASNKHPLYQKIISYPRYERSKKTARYTLVTPRPSDQFLLPVGFNLERAEGLNNTAVDPCEMPNLRLRGRDVHKVDPSLLGETPRRINPPPLMLQTIHSPPNNEQANNMQTPGGGGTGSVQETLRINAVFFPLLAALLPRWLGKIADKFGGEGGEARKVAAPLPSPNVKKVVVLVSGVGTPRNWTHSISGNSTQICAELMELFIQVLYPDITVVRIHSETNLFRYDENISFATQELLPCIDSYRDAHARGEPYPDEKLGDSASRGESMVNCESGMDASTVGHNPYNPDWRQSMSVTYSFADGSAARSHAIQASLRPYRPTYFHFWQLKTFWHETKITDEDIEVHSFEEMETVPAMAVDQTSADVMMVVNEMKAFRKYFIETLKGGRSDLAPFWLRKTKKPVLAVLLVRKPGGDHVLYRGTNMEVSMPTGSLCAERNVIGTALANDPGLKREDLLMVAVLSVQLPEYFPPPGPPGICQPVMPSGADFARDVEDKLKQHESHGGMRRSASTSSFANIAEDGPPVSSKLADKEEWEMDLFQPVSPLASPPLAPLSSAPAGNSSTPNAKETMMIPELNLSRLSEKSPSSTVSGQTTPKRRIALYQKKSHNKMGGGVKRQKESLLVQSLEDMNPLKPCGACNEWLKKIAESNPHFKVLTFTDTKCNGVFSRTVID